MSKAKSTTELILDVFRLNNSLLAAGEKLANPVGLTSARWQLLGAIDAAGKPLSVSHLALRMSLSRQAVQRVVKDMLKRGLVGEQANPHHKRSPLIYITTLGRQSYQKVMSRQLPWVENLSENLEEGDLRQASKLLRRLIHRLQEEIQ